MRPPYSMQFLGQQLKAEIKGDPDRPIEQLRDLEWISDSNPVQSDALYFVANAKAIKRRPDIQTAQCVLTSPELVDTFPNALIVPERELRIALAKLLSLFKAHASPPDPDGKPLSPSARIGKNCQIYPGAVIMDHACIGDDCRILPGAVVESYAAVGNRTTLHPHVVVGHHCTVGDDCILHAGTVLGADGFGFHDQGGIRYKLEQIGSVEIDDNVEIGAGCTIDRAAIEATRIGSHTKLDNQVHIAHNCQIGRFVFIAACTGIAGSSVVEDQVVIGGMCAISDHVRICSGTYLASMSGVLQSIEKPGIYFGIPVRPAREMHKIHAALKYLPDMVRNRRKGGE